MKKQVFLSIKIVYLILIVLIFIFSFFIKNIDIFTIYERYIFLPYQSFRSNLFNKASISFGDIFYLIVFISIIYAIIKLFLIAFNKNNRKRKLILFFTNFFISIVSIYLIYFISWGANYNRSKIYIPDTHFIDTTWNNEKLIVLNDKLIDSLNSFNTKNYDWDLQYMNKVVYDEYYKAYGTIPKLKTKPSLFGNIIFNLGIQGYYNPFTGEAQYVQSLPKYMWAFVIAHEMAHQLGIAAEGDANFMAYINCVKSDNEFLKYSAFFNLFLYANRELSRIDSTMALEKFNLLSSLNKENIETLKAMRSSYRGAFSGYALKIYDWMLQSQGQAKGVKSYVEIGKMVTWWEAAGKPFIPINTCRKK